MSQTNTAEQFGPPALLKPGVVCTAPGCWAGTVHTTKYIGLGLVAQSHDCPACGGTGFLVQPVMADAA